MVASNGYCWSTDQWTCLMLRKPLKTSASELTWCRLSRTMIVGSSVALCSHCSAMFARYWRSSLLDLWSTLNVAILPVLDSFPLLQLHIFTGVSDTSNFIKRDLDLQLVITRIKHLCYQTRWLLHLSFNCLYICNNINKYGQSQVKPKVVYPWQLTKRRYSQQVSEWDKFCQCHLVQIEWCADVPVTVRYIAEWSTLVLMSQMPTDQQTFLHNLQQAPLSTVTIQHKHQSLQSTSTFSHVL